MPSELAEAVEAILTQPFHADQNAYKVSGAGTTQPIPPHRAERQRGARTVTDARAALRLDTAPVKPTRKPRTVRARPPDGLRTKAEAAAKLGCSIKTLDGHVDSGALSYVPIGHGKKRVRRMFTDADLDQFIVNQTRKDVACPPTSPKTAARRISTTTSKCEVIGFTARRNARRAAKRKR